MTGLKVKSTIRRDYRIVLMPTRHLETFGTTVLQYHLISELMDSINQVRIREGRMQTSQPEIITPRSYSETLLEGFGEEATKYVEWLKEHEQDIRILQYGYKLKQEAFTEHVVTEEKQSVVDRVENEVRGNGNPLSAVVVGVDYPWDVCLIKLFWEVVQSSAHTNVQQLAQKNFFEQEGGIPKGMRSEIEKGFLEASRDPSKITMLGHKLQQYGLFEEYQDRFFSLVRSRKG